MYGAEFYGVRILWCQNFTEMDLWCQMYGAEFYGVRILWCQKFTEMDLWCQMYMEMNFMVSEFYGVRILRRWIYGVKCT